eukprot:1380957-Alexandrium_andersonii.AAC.1
MAQRPPWTTSQMAVAAAAPGPRCCRSSPSSTPRLRVHVTLSWPRAAAAAASCAGGAWRTHRPAP